MTPRIYKLEDGSTWYFDAESKEQCRSQWIAMCMETGYADEKGILDEFGEPEISVVQLVTAAKIKITTDERVDICPTCNGRGTVQVYDSLLDVWRENQSKPIEKKAHHGALANSEWP